MSLMKTGTCDSSVVTSSTVYVCNDCGHTEMASGDSPSTRKCPSCHASMQLVVSSNDAK